MTVATDIIGRTAEHVEALMTGESSGHDWWHVVRVRRLALRIAAEEGADEEIVELIALLHDIADAKFTGDEESGARETRAWVTSCGASPEIIESVTEAVRHLSYQGAGTTQVALTLEGNCVRDADRLDALGAIGIARAFAYGGHAGRVMYDPGVAPELHDTVLAYRAGRGTTVNHFHEKLLLLRDRMATGAGRRLAARRHELMADFLDDFHAEWSGLR